MRAAPWAASDPDANANFRRRWDDPLPQKRKTDPVTRIGFSGTQNFGDTAGYSGPDACAQRAIAFAERRAEFLDRQADILLSIGKRRQAERLAFRAASIREAVL